MQRSKVETFVGFSRRNRTLVAGTNALDFCKKAYVIFLCQTASLNAKKEAQKHARRLRAPIVLSKEVLLSDLVGRENCKMFALTDKKLAEAVLQNLDENYEIIFRGDNT